MRAGIITKQPPGRFALRCSRTCLKQENWQTGLLAGGAFAPYERFAPGKTSTHGKFILPEHFNRWRAEPPFGRRNKKRKTSAFSRCLSFLEHRNTIDTGRIWGPTQWGGAFAPYERFCRRRKPRRRGNSFAPIILISRGIHKNSHTFWCGYFYGLRVKSECHHSSLQPLSLERFQNGPFGPRRFCGVNSERSGELRRGGFADPEHFNAEG